MCKRIVLKSHVAVERLNTGVLQSEFPVTDITNQLDRRGVLLSLGPSAILPRCTFAFLYSPHYSVADFALVETDVHTDSCSCSCPT